MREYSGGVRECCVRVRGVIGCCVRVCGVRECCVRVHGVRECYVCVCVCVCAYVYAYVCVASGKPGVGDLVYPASTISANMVGGCHPLHAVPAELVFLVGQKHVAPEGEGNG